MPEPTDRPKTTAAVKPYIWITNNEDRARIMVLRGKKDPATEVLSPGPSFSLMPGATLVDARMWDRWKEQNQDCQLDGEAVRGQATILLQDKIPTDEHPHRCAKNAGHPYLVEGPRAGSKVNGLADLSDDQAKAIVSDIHDHVELRRLLQIEKRATVAGVIFARVQRFQQADAAGQNATATAR